MSCPITCLVVMCLIAFPPPVCVKKQTFATESLRRSRNTAHGLHKQLGDHAQLSWKLAVKIKK